jgi:thiol:disulfide interchange protein/DsbC/DsbD-like thiol-disulfide interchange protein
MPRRLLNLLLLLLATSLVGGSAVHGQPAQTPHVRAELLFEKPSAAPGETIWAALHLRMREGWHTYWRFPGDSGEPTAIDWTLPDGIAAGEIQWPYPQAIRMEPLTTYGYEGEVMLLVPFTVAASAQPGTTAQLQADVFWMVCEEVCIPEEVSLRGSLPISTTLSQPEPGVAAAFSRTRTLLPRQAAGWNILAAEGQSGFVLTLEPPAGVQLDGREFTFFATAGPLIEHSAPQRTSVENGALKIELARSPFLEGAPQRLGGVLVARPAWGGGWPEAVEFEVAVGPAVAVATTAAQAPAIAAGLPTSVWLALVLAFIGGLALNLMPCVFPVVSLKILSFMQSSGEEPRRVRIHGLAFAAGVLAAFWALAVLLLMLRAAGEEIGWGFQLQSPPFVAAMAFLLFLLGLSLAGVMDIGTSLTRAGGAGGGRYTTSAMNGVLATVVATPCTAPFMGAALGYALTQSPAISLLTFTSLGAGMAAPYVALSAWPSLMRYLPRPGAWMVRFKQLMAFPLFATVAWLVWVFGHQTGVDGVFRLLLGLTLVAAAAWVWGEWGTPSSAPTVRRVAAVFAAGAVIAAAIFAAGAPSAPPATGMAPAAVAAVGPIPWQRWSETAVAEHRAAGRPVFVDFTAAWCLTCKVNERVAFSSGDVQALIRDRRVAMLKADWTSRDPEITRALASFGRSGVPLYVFYESGAAEPKLLPEILTPGILIAELSQLR